MSNSIFQTLMNNSNNNMLNGMLNTLRANNPNAYNQLQGLLHSGNQEQAIMNMIGQLNPQQMAQFKNISNMMGVNVSKYIK